MVLGPGVRKNLSVVESYTRMQFKVMSRTSQCQFPGQGHVHINKITTNLHEETKVITKNIKQIYIKERKKAQIQLYVVIIIFFYKTLKT